MRVDFSEQALLQGFALGRVFLDEIRVFDRVRHARHISEPRLARPRRETCGFERRPGIGDRRADLRLPIRRRIIGHDIEAMGQTAGRPPRANDARTDNRDSLDG